MVACNSPARTGSAAAAAWAASRIRAHTGSTERSSAGFLNCTLSMALSFGPPPSLPGPGWTDRYASHQSLRRMHYPINSGAQFNGLSAGGAGFQFLDQWLDGATIILNVGIEIRTSSHEQADTLDFNVGDAQPLPPVAQLPFEPDRLAGGLVEAAVDYANAVGPVSHLTD